MEAKLAKLKLFFIEWTLTYITAEIIQRIYERKEGLRDSYE